MATLHVLSHSPFTDTRLSSCVRLLGPGDGLLLTGDAAYALAAGSEPRRLLEREVATNRLFVLSEDLVARNLSTPEGVATVDYPEFVELTLRFDRVNTWL